MDILISLNNQTSGRDKLARLIQYSSKALWYFVQQHRLSNVKSIEKIKRLEIAFSTFRKLLRFGRFIESFYGASRSFQHPNQLLKFTTTLSKVAFGMYLFCDHVICLEKVGLMDIQAQTWSSSSSTYWMWALIFLLVRNCYEILNILSNLGKLSLNGTWKRFYRDHRDVLADFFKNLFDLFIPMTALGYFRLTPGTIGLLGTLSSVLGILPLLQPYWFKSI